MSASIAPAGDSPTLSASDPAVRAKLAGPGFRAFVNIAREWQLNVEQQRILLGAISPSTFHKWKSTGVATVSLDQLERLSLVIGIYKALKLLFADDASGIRWLMAMNTEPTFAGHSPLDRMLHGSVDDLFAVRRYLDAWRGVWP